jgi:hypothetical protein
MNERSVNEQRDDLELEIVRLREELHNQWWSNHSEHCSDEWPHPEGWICTWPQPTFLEDRH